MMLLHITHTYTHAFEKCYYLLSVAVWLFLQFSFFLDAGLFQIRKVKKKKVLELDKG